MTDVNNVVRQWDVGQTAFTTAHQLINLITAVSADNVQIQSILAAENLGSLIRVSPTRINDAIVMLGGSTSVKWDKLKLLIGLRSGETIKIIRNSAPLLAYFLLISAFKTCYTDSELGDISFEFMAAVGVINNYPVASFQLCELIEFFSGHAAGLAPADLMHEIATKLDEFQPSNGDEFNSKSTFKRLTSQQIGKLLGFVYTALHDESVVSVDLIGSMGGLWLATVFLWMMPDETCVFFNRNVIMGSKNPKLSIHLNSDASDEWKIKEWKLEADPTSFIVESDLNSDTLSFVPRCLVNDFLKNGIGMPKKCLEESGALAGALVCLYIEYGKLGSSEYGDTVNLRDICNPKRLRDYTTVMFDYGWNDSILIQQNKFYDQLKSHLITEGNSLKVGKLKIISSTYDEYYQTMNYWAGYIAEDAIATFFCSFKENCNPGFDVSGFIGGRSLLSPRGLRFSRFRKICLEHLLPGCPQFDDLDLVVSSNGFVVGYSALWNINTKKSGALNFTIHRGCVEHQNLRYSCIREETTYPTTIPPQPEPEPERVDLANINAIGGHIAELRMLIAITGTTLKLKTTLPTHNHNKLSPDVASPVVSWIRAVEGLAGATHLEAAYDREAEPAAQHDATIFYCGAGPGVDAACEKSIVRSYKDETLRFFSAGSESQGSRCSTFVRQSASLLSCVQRAEEKGGRWRIIA